jgi:hypothetical protein
MVYGIHVLLWCAAVTCVAHASARPEIETTVDLARKAADQVKKTGTPPQAEVPCPDEKPAASAPAAPALVVPAPAAPAPVVPTPATPAKAPVLVPEILALKDGETIPRELYDKYSANQIAQTIVARVHREREKNENASHTDYDFRKNGAIQIVFHEKYFDSIREKCFLNEFQVDHPRDSAYQQRRLLVEDQVAGLKLEETFDPDRGNVIHKVRPKYAYLGLLKAHPSLKGHIKEDFYYGTVVAVFKDHVKDRATFTPENTFNAANDVHTFSYRPRKVGPMGRDGYWEAQVWGDLCLSDVDHFIVDCRKGRPSSPEFVQKLQTVGPPVYKCDANRTPGGGFAKGKRVTRGQGH